MLLSPKIISSLLALGVSTFTTLAIVFLGDLPPLKLALFCVISFLISFTLILFSLEFLIFREINQLHLYLNKLKKKDFKIAKKRLSTVSPLLKLNDEIFNYAENKQKEIDQLLQLETFRREFLADVSHELKTPIFAAQGFIHTLLDGAKDDPKVRDKFLNRAAKSLDGLDHLVKDLIMLSKIQSGFISFDKEPVNVVYIIEEVLLQLENKARERDIKLLLEIEEEYDEEDDFLIKADTQRLRRVFINLIDNAIKYGNDYGHVYINIKRKAKKVVVSIKDDGPGISKKHLNRIFERFYRVEKSRSKDRGGSGLGLAIVKQVLDAHDATISAQSKATKGTTFTVKINVFQDHSPVEQSPASKIDVKADQ